MSWCKYCGARIDWIRTKKGRFMPVEYMPVMVMPGRGTETFVTDEGEVFQGKQTLPCAVGGGNVAAYIPHWGRCSGRPKGAVRNESVSAGGRGFRE